MGTLSCVSTQGLSASRRAVIPTHEGPGWIHASARALDFPVVSQRVAGGWGAGAGPPALGSCAPWNLAACGQLASGSTVTPTGIGSMVACSICPEFGSLLLRAGSTISRVTDWTRHPAWIGLLGFRFLFPAS